LYLDIAALLTVDISVMLVTLQYLSKEEKDKKV